jgi:pyruvate/2-oxoglutarate dehydrogenase complex dihydrolipoamide dehydrogenase (E3) component
MAVGSSNDFDLVVLGAGTGGLRGSVPGGPAGPQGRARRRGQDRRARASIAAASRTKALLRIAAFAERVRHAKEYGLGLPASRRSTTPRWPRRAGRREADVDRLKS